MKKRFEEALLHVSNYLEIFISILMVIMLTILSIKLLFIVIEPNSYVDGQDNLTLYLTMALNLAVGVEFVKMLCKHTPETIIEVLLFATARQMIVYHMSAIDTLIGVGAIAGLFATRKYLFCAFDETSAAIFRATQKSKMINWLFRINIPEEAGETLGEVVINKLTEDEKEIATGSCVYFSDFALRIAKMHGEVITRIEVIRSI
ncbi:MAG TPA: transporter [Lachnospiraceae bacterium]|nr:transporter [Lachnospiraceae bacterium]